MKLNLTYSDELYHYGVKGMKWGVRRYQNRDGTRTSLGKQRALYNRIKRDNLDAYQIHKKLSPDDLRKLGKTNKEIELEKNNLDSYERYKNNHIGLAYRNIIKDNNGKPVAYVNAVSEKVSDINSNNPFDTVNQLSIYIATDPDSRGKGYATKAGKRLTNWFNRYGHKDYKYMEWAVRRDNDSSRKIAEKLGFVREPRLDGPQYIAYYYGEK